MQKYANVEKSRRENRTELPTCVLLQPPTICTESISYVVAMEVGNKILMLIKYCINSFAHVDQLI